jgi:hypothetical protein
VVPVFSCGSLSCVGCLNGGGQIRPAPDIPAAEWLRRVRADYERTVPRPPAASPAAALRTARTHADEPAAKRPETLTQAPPPAAAAAAAAPAEDGPEAGMGESGPGGAWWHTQYCEVRPTEGLLGALKW